MLWLMSRALTRHSVDSLMGSILAPAPSARRAGRRRRSGRVGGRGPVEVGADLRGGAGRGGDAGGGGPPAPGPAAPRPLRARPRPPPPPPRGPPPARPRAP